MTKQLDFSGDVKYNGFGQNKLQKWPDFML